MGGPWCRPCALSAAAIDFLVWRIGGTRFGGGSCEKEGRRVSCRSERESIVLQSLTVASGSGFRAGCGKPFLSFPPISSRQKILARQLF